jgi:hypothetical protein
VARCIAALLISSFHFITTHAIIPATPELKIDHLPFQEWEHHRVTHLNG